MAPDEPRGREMPLLVYLLVASFALMLLSGAMFMLGLPEAESRALFLATVVIWIAIGIWIIVDGQLETRRIAAAQATARAKATEAGADAAAGTGAEADAGAKSDAGGPSATPPPATDDGAKAQ